MEKRYPKPHPVFLQEHEEATDQLRAARERLAELNEKLFQSQALVDVLFRRLNGSTSDPWSDTEHPGHLLTLMGWQHHPDDESGLNWIDPVYSNGVAVHRTLPEALAVTCQRLLHRLSNVPTSIQRIDDEDTT